MVKSGFVARMVFSLGVFSAILFGIPELVPAQPIGSPCPSCPSSQNVGYPPTQDPLGGLDFRYLGELSQDMQEQVRAAEADWQARRWDRAVERYRFITENFPSTPEAARAHMRIGLYLKFGAQWDRAIEEFKRGIDLIPGTREAQDAKTSIACIHGSRGNYDEALDLLREVLSETRDWDQVKHCSYWTKTIERRKQAQRAGRLRSCGEKALALVLRMKGMDVSKESFKTLRKGVLTSMEELRRVAEAEGLKPVGMKVGLEHLRELEMPLIALVRPGHYVVILGVGDKGYEVIDPELGETPLVISSRERMQDLWTGSILSFAQGDNPPKKALSILSRKEMESLYGGVCLCCPEGELGGAEDNPNVAMDIIERSIRGCVQKGMPRLSVSLFPMNLVVEDTDFSYSGLGPTVEIKRTYNSDDPRESVFGLGWSFNYGISIFQEGAGVYC